MIAQKEKVNMIPGKRPIAHRTCMYRGENPTGTKHKVKTATASKVILNFCSPDKKFLITNELISKVT
jgi:hypothetical protein